jgi:O-antigen ligase
MYYQIFLKNKTKSLMFNLGQIDIRVLVSLLILAVLSTLIGFRVARMQPLIPIALLAGIGIGIATLVNTNLGLTILIFSMLLSPEIPLAQTPERAVVVRIDDFLIMAVFFAWLAKTAVRKELGLLRKSPLNKPILAYIAVNIFATGLGILSGDVKPAVSIFYILKYIEYVMVYFLFINNLDDLKQIKIFIFCFLMVAFVIGAIAYTQIGHLPRPTAPFEGKHAEPNTLAGYLVLTFAVAMGILLYTKSFQVKLFLTSLIFFNFYPFLMTLSRSGYLGFIIIYLIFLFLSRRHRLALVLILLASIIFVPAFIPEKVVDRISYTFTGGSHITFGGRRINLEQSALARIQTWQIAVKSLKDRLFFGFGVTGAGFMDNQYARFISETGIVGFLIAMWLILTILINSFQIFRNSKDDYAKGLSLGFLAGYIAILTIGLAANVFIIVRISEPFWFVCACVMVLPEIQQIQT